MGKKNQIYARWIRILPNPDNENEIYLVLAKDKPMERKYLRQFDDMFAGKDVLITIIPLVRGKNKMEVTPEGEEIESQEATTEESPFWSVEE